MSLRVKMWLLSGLVFVGLIAIVAVSLLTLRQAANQDNVARVEQLLTSTYSTVTELERLAASGQLSDAQAQRIATELLRANIYHDSEYVYVADADLNFVAAPLDPELHGTSFHEFRDSRDASVGDILLKALESARGELATYPWTQTQADGSVEDKLSIAQRTPRWNWIVGTGIGFDETNERFWSSARSQLAICLVLALLIVVPVQWTVKAILRDLGGEPKEVLASVLRVAEGDLQTYGQESDSKADNRSIFASVSKMRLSLREMIGALSQSGEQLHHISEDIVGKAENSTAKAEEQNEITERIAAAAEEFNAQTQQAMDQARQAGEQTRTATRIANEGQTLISGAVERFSHIDESVNTTHRSIEHLVERINEISSVISVINGVAEQTNLLALNAAIEAARAGDQGRGFAVVADEVRQLASRTTQATREIDQTIRTVQESSQETQTNMAQMVEELKDGIEQTREGGSTVESIQQETRAVERIVAEIEAAMSEHVTTSSHILTYLEQMEASSAEVKSTSRGTLETSKDISSASQQLSDILGRFKL